jgi:site-specific recombinase XerD
VSGPLLLPRWDELAVGRPVLVATMRRYLTQIACTLRPGSVKGSDLGLRCFATFLDEQHREIDTVAAVRHGHNEDYKPWLATRPGQKVPRLTPSAIAHRLGNVRMFFIRIDEWGWNETPARVPIVNGDLPRQDHPLPKALDDAAAAKFLPAAQTQRRMLVRVVCEVLLRTGLGVSELTNLQAGAVVQIGVGHWLHVPLGKLHDDRYLPLHPHLVELIGDYRDRHVDPDNPLLVRQADGPALRHPVLEQGRLRGRHRARPPTPDAAHPRHPSQSGRNCI